MVKRNENNVRPISSRVLLEQIILFGDYELYYKLPHISRWRVWPFGWERDVSNILNLISAGYVIKFQKRR